MGSSDELIIVLAAAGGVALAYATNAGGFKDWISSLGGGFQEASAGGKSGNCTWDSTGHYCWASSACGGACKTCILVGTSPTTTDGCGRARSYFLSNSNKCPACKSKGVPSSTPPQGCPQCKALGTRAVKINGKCTCEKVPNPLGLYASAYNTNAYPDQPITVS